MAEGLFRNLLQEKDRSISVASAGIAAQDGTPASIETRKILLEHGVDFTSFKSQQLTEEHLAEADYVFCMSRMHCQAILSHSPEYREKALLLGEFLGEKEPKDIFDPFGLGAEAYAQVERQVVVAVKNILAFIHEGETNNSVLEDEE